MKISPWQPQGNISGFYVSAALHPTSPIPPPSPHPPFPSISSWHLAEDRLSVIPPVGVLSQRACPRCLHSVWLTVHQIQEGAAKGCGGGSAGMREWSVNHVRPDVAPQISRWVLKPRPPLGLHPPRLRQIAAVSVFRRRSRERTLSAVGRHLPRELSQSWDRRPLGA